MTLNSEDRITKTPGSQRGVKLNSKPPLDFQEVSEFMGLLCPDRDWCLWSRSIALGAGPRGTGTTTSATAGGSAGGRGAAATNATRRSALLG